MPEGDTIHRAARQLQHVIAGHTVEDASDNGRFVDANAVRGLTVARVEARGKYLLVHFESDAVLLSHMGMTGSWHLYKTGSPWRKPRRQAAVVLGFNDLCAVCFSPKTLDLITRDRLRRHSMLSRLGPDLLDNSLDVPQAIARLRVHHATPLGEAVMNQSVVCGVGNVWKSETLFLLGMNPFASVEQFSDEQLHEWLALTRRLMRRNLDGGARRTRFRGDATRLWVYNRAGERCLKCDSTIDMRRQGDLGRSTYFCMDCQKMS